MKILLLLLTTIILGCATIHNDVVPSTENDLSNVRVVTSQELGVTKIDDLTDRLLRAMPIVEVVSYESEIEKALKDLETTDAIASVSIVNASEYIVLDTVNIKGKHYKLLTRDILEDNIVTEKGMPMTRPLSRSERFSGVRPTTSERNQNPGNITCMGSNNKLAVGVSVNMAQPDPGDKRQCIFKDVQSGYQAVAVLIAKKYSDKPIKVAFNKWQSDKKAFNKKLRACKSQGVDINKKFSELNPEQMFTVINVWRKYEGYRDNGSSNYIVIPVLVA